MRKNRYIRSIDKDTNYQNLVSTTLKEKYHYFLIGIVVLLGITVFGSYLIFKDNKVTNVVANKDISISVTPNVTSTETPAVTPTTNVVPTSVSTPSAGRSAEIEKPRVDPTAAAVASEAKPGEGFTKYVVKAGDTLWKIAEEAYNSGFNYRELVEYNKITDPNTIAVGQVVLLPTIVPGLPTNPEVIARGGIGGPAPETEQGIITDVAAMTTPVVESSTSYTVSKGDTLWTISEKTFGDGFSWRELAKANNIENQRELKVGTVLKIPR